MEDWDAQKMLDKYIHDYMIRNNMHGAANIFAEEANICLRPVAINSEEGFLAEWWSLFWDVYSDILSKHPTTTEGYGSKDSTPVNYQATQNAGNCSQKILLEMERPDMNDMSQNISAAMGMLGLPNQPQTVHLTAMPSPDMENLHRSTPPMTMPRPDMVNFLQSAVPITMQRPELNPYCLGSPFLDFDIQKGDFLTNLVAASIHEQEHLMFPERALDFNSQLLNVDQLTRMLPSSSKYSYPLEMVPQKPFGNGGFVTNIPGSIAAQPIHHGESNLIQPKAEPSDSEFVGQCVRKGHCCCLELDSSTSSNSASSDPSPEFKNLF